MKERKHLARSIGGIGRREGQSGIAVADVRRTPSGGEERKREEKLGGPRYGSRGAPVIGKQSEHRSSLQFLAMNRAQRERGERTYKVMGAELVVQDTGEVYSVVISPGPI
jgi:hypothetical protein